MATRPARPSLDPSTQSFGTRLRLERERRKISISSIAESTKILGALLEGLEHDDVSRWPTGFYRRAFFRAYADAIGLNPETTLKEFLERFPEPEDSATPSAAPPAVEATAAPAAVRVGMPAAGSWFGEGALVAGLPLRIFAVAFDLFLLSVAGLALFSVLGAFWAPLCLATVAYYSVSILALGNTPGVCLFADPQKRRRLSLTFQRDASSRDAGESAVQANLRP